MKRKLLLISLGCFLFFPSLTFANDDLYMLDSMSFKATIIIDGVETEWEYVNPDEYEWEKGNEVIKDEKAKQEVQKIFKKLNVDKNSKVEEMVKAIEEMGYSNIEKFDVRWIDRDGELYTWVWESE
jgi:hypothetical protein